MSDIILARDGVYSETELLTMLQTATNIPEGIRGAILSHINGSMQFIANMLVMGDAEFLDSNQSKFVNYPDSWEKGYNAMVALYQSNHPDV